MIVPLYWSESKTKKVVEGRQFTIKRFGWSDISEEEAKKHADSRLAEAVKTLEEQGDVRRIDHKVSYNGAEGIPIREEVVSKFQDIVISRNSYGALCLNTPDVLFADIDFEDKASFKLKAMVFTVLMFTVFLASVFYHSLMLFILGFFAISSLTSIVAEFIYKSIARFAGSAEQKAINRVESILADLPELNMRLYRTPMGMRVLFMNNTYSPEDEKTIRILEYFRSDKLYVQMCKNQNCFRARVSPKPWRIGTQIAIPGTGAWPVPDDRLTQRSEWIRNYDRKAKDYASCRFISQLGSTAVNSKAEAVRNLHDEMCKANNNKLEIA